ncbi:hypothetical protein CASFOL_042920 [Castilleja foliolosa]|uniref:Uncharacterized protein n=1 Tax=Castilleja foliolosa TaxID=1961234 RepID=A0ABD3B7G9_9LAMI
MDGGPGKTRCLGGAAWLVRRYEFLIRVVFEIDLRLF